MVSAKCVKKSLKSLQTKNTMYRKLNFIYTITYICKENTKTFTIWIKMKIGN